MLVTVLSNGCAILRERMLQQIQEQQVANIRLTVLAVLCILMLPIALWAGLVWGTKTISLRSWWILLTIECILLALVASARTYLFIN